MMDMGTAFMMGRATRDRELMVFDWEKAARIIRERNVSDADAGLSGDWDSTSGAILRAGIPVPRGDTSTYLASTWATPELEIDGAGIDCYRMQSETPGWDASTSWPPAAVKILKAERPSDAAQADEEEEE